MKMTSMVYSKEILDKINDDTIVIIARNRKKNIDFMKRYSITSDDIGYYIRNLNKNDFVEKIKNANHKINTDYLYVFHKRLFLVDEYGENIEQVYIKIGILINQDNTIYVESFHDEYNF